MDRWTGNTLTGYLVACCVVAISLLGSVSAWAADKVIMILEPGSEERQSLDRAVASQLSDLDVQFLLIEQQLWSKSLLETIRSASDHARKKDTLAVFWIDESHANRVVMLVSHNDDILVLMRSLSGRRSEGKAEEVAIIVRSSVREVLRGEAELKSPEEIVSAAVIELNREPGATEPLKLTSDFRRLGVRVGYRMQWWEKGAASHGIALRLDLRLSELWEIFGGFSSHVAVEINGETADFEMTSHPIILGARFGRRLGDFKLQVGLAWVLDCRTIQTVRLAAGLEALEDDVDWVPGLEPTFSVSWEMLEQLNLFLVLGANVSLVNNKYTVDLASGSEVVFHPSRVSPTLQVGLLVDVF